VLLNILHAQDSSLPKTKTGLASNISGAEAERLCPSLLLEAPLAMYRCSYDHGTPVCLPA
jgi:hypothetical protein